MAPKTKSNLSTEINQVADASTIDNTPTTDGPPYEAAWLTITAAATHAGVSGSAIRVAIEKRTALFDGKTFKAPPRDMFGNVVGRAIEYVDKAAVDAWLNERATNPPKRGGRKNDGAFNYTTRLTADQLSALEIFIGKNEAENFNGVSFKRNERKTKPVVEAASTNGTHDAVPVDVPDLFDVDVS